MNKKTKKQFLAIISIISICVIGYFGNYIYKENQKPKIEKRITEFLINEGYSPNDILSITIDHSLKNKIFSLPEWGFRVIFANQPDYHYYYLLNKEDVLEAGVIDTTNSLDVECAEDHDHDQDYTHKFNFLTGSYFRLDDFTHLIIDRSNTPIIINNETKEDLASQLSDGDTIRAIIGSLQEGSPSSTNIYAFSVVNKGNFNNINTTVLETLRRLKSPKILK